MVSPFLLIGKQNPSHQCWRLEISKAAAENTELTFWKFGLSSLEQNNKNMTRVCILLLCEEVNVLILLKKYLAKNLLFPLLRL
jgi:hypothetical protein